MPSKGRSSVNKLARLRGTSVKLLKRLVFEESSLKPEDLRSENRTPVVGEVDVEVLDESGACDSRTRVFVRDLSKSGCSLWSRARFPANVTIALHFPATREQPPLLRFAEVLHCRAQNGAGFAVGCRFIRNSDVA
jgi:hypothetical protein